MSMQKYIIRNDSKKIRLCYEIESLDIQCLQINRFVGESSLKSKAAFSHLVAFILPWAF